MLKKARLLTRPTPARQDAPFRGQGRSERLKMILSKLARVSCPWDGSDESPTARVQRGPSEGARCASTGDSPGHPIPCWRTFSAFCITVSPSIPDSSTPLLPFPAPSYFHLRAGEAAGRWPASPQAVRATRQHSAARASLHP